MFVVETILFSQFAWVSVFSSSNLSVKHAYMAFPKLSIVCCVLPDSFSPTVPPFAARISRVAADVQAPGGESGNV